MKRRYQRLLFILTGLAAIGLAAYLVLNALGNNLSYFFSPTEVLAGEAPSDRVFRLGGMVQADSVQRIAGDMTVNFVLTDYNKTISVAYTGILPDLFAEGQGAIAQGKINADGVFIADEVLAKHDENYMPPEVAEAIEAGKKAQNSSPYSQFKD